ncbi:hypothetical protein TEA_011117 [Camellia sinensis var. sinensis]|uniref:Uncharacterized protein n=1 Tax=Camellia sinensis var. sinensis TaxID=542762 RepID=A0A4S4EDW0_CAMSN|nr:hypothetical protein TEA_011117 [Camellia sinensis var. sinensis]
MAEMMIAGSLLSASFKVLFERLACPLFVKFFKSLTRHNEGDKLLKKLKSKLLRLSVILNDAEKQQFTNQLVKDWLDELKDAIYHADDLVDEIATKALGCKVEAEFRSAVKNQVTTSTSTSDSSVYDAKLVSQMEEIIKRLECFLEEKDDLGLKEIADLKWSHSHRLPSTSLVDESGVYGRDDDKEKIIKILLLGEASSLQHLTDFVVGKCSGSAINELKEFHNLRAKLTISGLQNVKSGRDALEAKLKEKEHLEEIVLEWGKTTEDSQNEREVLENLQPHKNLKRLTIKRYGGTRFSEWLGDHSYFNIVSLCIDKCDHCFSLPPLGKLPSLKHLNIARMNGIIMVGEEFYGDGSSTKPFQSLETLRFEEMLEWVEWYILGAEEFSQLKELCIIKCPKLVGGLPIRMPSWVSLEIRECSALTALLPRTSVANKLVLNGCNGVDLGWHGVSSLVKLEISNMPSLKELTPELHMLTNLQELIIRNCRSLVSFPHTGLPLMLTRLEVRRCEALDSVNVCLNTRLQKLVIENCSSLLSFAVGVLPITLNLIHISKCPKLVFSVSEEMECCNSSLKWLSLHSCGTLKSLPLGFFPKLRHLNTTNFEILSIPNGHGPRISTSLVRVEISGCNSMVSCLQEALYAPNLKTFWVQNCKKLKLLPEGMHTHLPSLESLTIWNCPEIETFPEGGLPSNLRRLQVWGCKKLVDCRREWGLQRLPSLTEFVFGGGKYEEEDDDVLESFLEEALLPPTLTLLGINNLQNLKSINYQSFQHLTCLKELRICQCPQLQSLPEEGFLASLSMLEIFACPLLKPRCERDRGDEWHKIAHIPFVKIDDEVICFEQLTGNFRDGANLTVLFAGELLQNAEELIRMGLHPSEIIIGYPKATNKTVEILDELVEKGSEKMDVRNKDEVIKRMKATVASKEFGLEDILCPLIAEVVMFVGGVNTSATETKGTVLIHSAEQLENYAKTEDAKVEELIKEIAYSSAKVIVSGAAVGKMALHFYDVEFADISILASSPTKFIDHQIF